MPLDTDAGATTESTAVETQPTGTAVESTQAQSPQEPAAQQQDAVDIDRVLRENARLKRALKGQQEKAAKAAVQPTAETPDLLRDYKKQVDDNGNEAYEYAGMLVPKEFAERQAQLAAELETLRAQSQQVQAEQFAQYKQDVQDEVVQVIKTARESIADFGDPDINARVESMLFNHFDSTVAGMLNSGAPFDEKTIGEAVKSSIALLKTIYAAGAEAQLSDNARYKAQDPVKSQGQAGVPTKPVSEMNRTERAAYAKAIADKVQRERSGSSF